MNNIIELKGSLEARKSAGRPGAPTLPKKAYYDLDKIVKIRDNLIEITNYWDKDEFLNKDIIVSVFYNQIVAKSNRIKCLLNAPSYDPNDSILGAFFTDNKHVITYKYPKKELRNLIGFFDDVINIVHQNYGTRIDYEIINQINNKPKSFDKYSLRKSKLSQFLVDIYYVEKISVYHPKKIEVDGDAFITLYNLGDDTINNIFEILKISILNSKKIGNNSFCLSYEDYLNLYERVPYLIAMSVEDISKITSETLGIVNSNKVSNIGKPTIEPIIGVIDKPFDKNAYFKDWVEYVQMIPDEIEIKKEDYSHGTSVSSIIVDGPTIDPNLDDGCGRFRVRHFGVAVGNKFSSFSIMKKIEKIILENRDIVVWNLSLGAEREVEENYVSIEASILDELQTKYNVIFVVSGTNRTDKQIEKRDYRIGSPADTINGLVVNSVDFKNKPASYTRVGPVLSFFNKPDVAYYGGDFNEKIRLCNGLGELYSYGTSFSAPWIARKIAFMIHILGFPIEIAKAVLLDSATSWKKQLTNPTKIGFGVVPIRIEDVVNSKNDEIKFYLYGHSEKYDTFTYRIPVPVDNLKQPFIAKATICYFPHCSRNQGVDYTNIELDIHFGRLIQDSNNKIKILTINDNKQAIPDMNCKVNEEQARKEYRKWDNVKHICEKEKNRKIPKEMIGKGLWGLSVKKVSRFSYTTDDSIPFGVVVTLKEIFGKNRIDEFVQQCLFNGWIINRIDINQKIAIYNKVNEDIDIS